MSNMKCSRKLSKPLLSSAGFTLIEIMITAAIFAIVAASMLTLYINMQQNTSNQQEIVDVQQNLRVAMDYLCRDIRMAGAMVSGGAAPISASSDATTLRLLTGSSTNTMAFLGEDFEVAPSAADAHYKLPRLMLPSMANLFTDNMLIRIIRPENKDALEFGTETDLLIVEVDKTTDPTDPRIYVKKPANSLLVQVKKGDMIARVSPGLAANAPSTIDWDLDASGNLRRNLNDGGAATVADGITSLAFKYRKKDGTEIDDPDSSDLEDLVGVRVTITGLADAQSDGVNRTRSISSFARLRNIDTRP